jgi:hypothetical protein
MSDNYHAPIIKETKKTITVLMLDNWENVLFKSHIDYSRITDKDNVDLFDGMFEDHLLCVNGSIQSVEILKS